MESYSTWIYDIVSGYNALTFAWRRYTLPKYLSGVTGFPLLIIPAFQLTIKLKFLLDFPVLSMNILDAIFTLFFSPCSYLQTYISLIVNYDSNYRGKFMQMDAMNLKEN